MTTARSMIVFDAEGASFQIDTHDQADDRVLTLRPQTSSRAHATPPPVWLTAADVDELVAFCTTEVIGWRAEYNQMPDLTPAAGVEYDRCDAEATPPKFSGPLRCVLAAGHERSAFGPSNHISAYGDPWWSGQAGATKALTTPKGHHSP